MNIQDLELNKPYYYCFENYWRVKIKITQIFTRKIRVQYLENTGSAIQGSCEILYIEEAKYFFANLKSANAYQEKYIAINIPSEPTALIKKLFELASVNMAKDECTQYSKAVNNAIRYIKSSKKVGIVNDQKIN